MPLPQSLTPIPVRKHALSSLGVIVASINSGTLLALAALVLFVWAESAHPNPAGIAIIGLLPLTVGAVILTAVVDALWLGAYVFSRQKPRKRRLMAAFGLMISLAILVVSVTYFKSLQGTQLDIARQDASGYQALLDKANAAGYGFDLVAPTYLPKDYGWAQAKVHADSGSDTTFFQVDYNQVQNQTDTGNSFSIIEYSKRPTFNPPTSCGYYLAPNNNASADTMKMLYPCSLVGATASGSKVYLYYGNSQVGSTTDNYYLQDGNTVVVLDVDSGEDFPQADAIKILGSVKAITLDELAKKNASGNKFQ